jgi:hypothetical protein
MLHDDRDLIPLNERLYTFSSEGGVSTLGAGGQVQRLVQPALQGLIDSPEKVFATLACAARQSRSSNWLQPGAPGHNKYFCVECGEPATSFSTVYVSWLSARHFLPTGEHPWIQSVGFAECSLACERAISEPRRLLGLFACAASGDRVGGYEAGDVVLASTSMFGACVPVAFPHPFLYAARPQDLDQPESAAVAHLPVPSATTPAALDPADPAASTASRSRRVCANPACLLKTDASAAAPKLKQCSRCETVRYCGADCQKAHWRSGHKQACVPK